MKATLSHRMYTITATSTVGSTEREKYALRKIATYFLKESKLGEQKIV